MVEDTTEHRESAGYSQRDLCPVEQFLLMRSPIVNGKQVSDDEFRQLCASAQDGEPESVRILRTPSYLHPEAEAAWGLGKTVGEVNRDRPRYLNDISLGIVDTRRQVELTLKQHAQINIGFSVLDPDGSANLRWEVWLSDSEGKPLLTDKDVSDLPLHPVRGAGFRWEEPKETTTPKGELCWSRVLVFDLAQS
ncbi:MAG: hypothetical protein A2700_00340 [Candidatus Blackburnbacteria bacterium RIFCSPHIGHO2_01_FULL_44_64]|uniref:Uncharacterized protein n=1 Tax=Candidatus Blackburnbacteria bacterium RIFCSPHIGHO2_02_FULL_44_20 TaxID=1797516 RepID=A0A1G1V7R8_9BACT|nr:MAG: hypothetical protein A2700_00340 [Candidatus Blackburnbacteria bacterium RIFCSPHIGHO2_01_FULL_44_64]OGY10226.1 MAG: hypothetical protein A3E16_03385 [Candidatus Blackburnbacteria bacterium RIFCSPHIGHO2_12_FULL_44_25]OGY11367.1 MAG: hypothetical protein A3D26_02580 [Candidatus Blackburnbacteria bacterium RIFCSPHIGHO2_02_FULL_44_20]OGY13543.1 MAG: hypothetical protein A3A62_01005 [Candidatus Blackburnbacteria bacterium RIFCSPLOWO2_01_FULL_44_43]OGY16761.1 MAG: hypothetical protein A3H88_0